MQTLLCAKAKKRVRPIQAKTIFCCRIAIHAAVTDGVPPTTAASPVLLFVVVRCAPGYTHDDLTLLPVAPQLTAELWCPPSLLSSRELAVLARVGWKHWWLLSGLAFDRCQTASARDICRKQLCRDSFCVKSNRRTCGSVGPESPESGDWTVVTALWKTGRQPVAPCDCGDLID